MKSKVIDLKGKAKKDITLPEVFSEPYRPDLIKKAVLVAQANRRQPYGPSKHSGMMTSAEGWGTGRGVARVPRIRTGRRAARVPQAVGGRKAHPPKPEKNWSAKINKKERRKAIRSAISATTDPEIVSARGHRFNGVSIPVIVEDGLQELGKNSDVREFLQSAGLWEDVLRAKRGRTIRAGKGKRRGRKYKKRRSILFVVSEDNGIFKAGRNLPGVDITHVSSLSTELLAPGTHAGRLTVWTESAISQLEEAF